MEAFIRKRKDFSKHLIQVYSYDTVLADIFEQNSTVTTAYDENIAQDDFIICGEFVGVVKSVSVNGKSLTLSCSGLDSAFDRTLYYDIQTNDNMTSEELLKIIFEQKYKNCDSMYAMPYLEIRDGISTPLVKPSRNSDGLYTLSAYISKLRKKGLNIQYDLLGETLCVTFAKYPTDEQNIDFVCHNTVTSETYGGHTIAKITNYTNGVPDSYYLLNDGTVTKDENADNRAYGTWEVMTNAEESAVLERFDVTYGHEIKFTSKERYSLYTPLKLRMPSGRILESFISSVSKHINDDHYSYTAGELKTTLTAKLKK